MTLATLLQIAGACLGVIGSLFFAIGIMRQSVNAMADLAGTYFDANPHMIVALAAQRADYLFGGGLIVFAFATSLLSYLFTNVALPISERTVVLIPWIAILLAIVCFFGMRVGARRLALRYEGQIRDRLKEKDLERKKQDEERRKARVEEDAKCNT